jgi:iron complex outermembrane recepter protein
MKTKFIYFSVLFVLFFSLTALSQTTVKGKVTDKTSAEPLNGVTIVVKGTTLGIITNNEGEYTLVVPSKNVTLKFSFVGYETIEQTVGENSVLNIALSQSAISIDEVVVTGSFDERTKLESSVAISTINSKQIQILTPNSSIDLLKSVPGIFVNSSSGEIRNQVYTRGLGNEPGYNNDVSGLYYLSLQEDGLPVTNVVISNYSSDVFYRSDATLNRLEAVRGGTASIAGANAPGGIFNYLSKIGGDKFTGSVVERLGLEANGKNFYYRTDINLGGPLGKGWFYNIGGFYRSSKGAHDVGYLFNYGGQVKANLQKKYAKGSITLYGKYLNDHNGTNLMLIGRNFDHPELVSGISNTDAFILPEEATVSTRTGDGLPITFDPAKLNHSKEISIGANWKHDLGNGFKIQNNAKYSAKTLSYNVTSATSISLLTDLVPNAIAGTIGSGNIAYRDNLTKESLAVVQASIGQYGPQWNVLSNNLPNQNILQNGILYQAADIGYIPVNEFMDQFVISKKTEKLSLNLGLFLALSNTSDMSAGLAGAALTTMENQPRMLDMTYQNNFAGGVTQQISSPRGYFKTGGVFGYRTYEYNKTNIAPFLTANWKLAEKLNFDVGVRFESNVNEGTNTIRQPNDGSDGGLDGDPLTTYDNAYYKNPTDVHYKFDTQCWSYSGALNYLISGDQSLYARYSIGRKAPEGYVYQVLDTPEQVALSETAIQKVTQLETGYKIQSEKIELAFTAFYSLLSNVYSSYATLDENNVLYQLTPYYNKRRSLGVETEATYYFNKNFSTRISATLQNTTWPSYKISTAGPTASKDDDTFYDYSGNQAALTPDIMLSITPTYITNKFSASLSYQYIGSRPANTPNAFELPGYSQIDLSIGYNITPKLSLNANVNNVLNSLGVMNWGAPGGFPAVYQLSDFTKEKMLAQKDMYFPIMGTAPRSYFLTLSYTF